MIALVSVSGICGSTAYSVPWMICAQVGTNSAFQKDKTVLIYCGSGGRAALSGKTLKDLGYHSVYNAGGFKELADAGLETEPA